MKLTQLLSILVFVVIFISQSLTAQISLELVGGLDRSFRSLIVSDISNQLVIESRKENEISKLQHRFGINALVTLLPSLQFKSGLRYAETGYIVATYSETQVWGGGTSELPYLQELYKDYVYLEVPLQLRWSLLHDSKISPFIEGGINPHFNLHRKTNQVYSDGNIVSMKSNERETPQVTYRSVYYVAVGSLGASVQITDALYLTALTTGRFHLTELNKNDSPINEKHKSIGGEFGVGYQF